MTNKAFGTLYIGVTNNLIRRVFEHKEKFVEGFTEQYDLDKLVYYEVHDSIESAIMREKQLKKWNRNWKLRLIMEIIRSGKICMKRLPKLHRLSLACHPREGGDLYPAACGWMQVSKDLFRLQRYACLAAWIPAFAGMTKMKAGMTKIKARMTRDVR